MQAELNKRNDELEKETASIREKVVNQLEKVALLNESILSVYFNAVRDEPYLGGGEEYLTFTRCTVNSCLKKTRYLLNISVSNSHVFYNLNNQCYCLHINKSRPMISVMYKETARNTDAWTQNQESLRRRLLEFIFSPYTYALMI